MKISLLIPAITLVVIACNDSKKPESTTNNTPVPAAAPAAPEMPELPAHVLYKNWEQGNPAYVKMISDAYQSWDKDNQQELVGYFADSVIFDLPEGKRIIARKTVGEYLKKWRSVFAATENIPFSLVSLHNKDLNQDWVIAWTWNKWKYKDGVKDSMLYSDNWRVVDGRISQLVSLQQKPNKQLSRAINDRLVKD